MEETPKRDNFLAMSILIAAFVVGGSFIYSAGLKGGNSGGLAQVGGGDPSENVGGTPLGTPPEIDDDVILGDPDAPVTIIAFGDYQCPFCKKLFDESERQIRAEYIETGKVRMVYRDFPLDQPPQPLHPFARGAAEAAECARDQGKYWAYHDKLFTLQSQLSSDPVFFEGIAVTLDLDMNSFRACVQSRKYKDEVEKDYQDGVAAGVRGTPATFVNGKLISGAVPFASFKAAIDEALQKSGK